jgi:hypothetical protein
MALRDWLPLVPDHSTYFVPWVQFQTDEGDHAEGPMLRQGAHRRELLAWLVKGEAEAAAQALVAQTGGSFTVQPWGRKDLQDHCRQYSSWGSRVVAVVLKPGEVHDLSQ